VLNVRSALSKEVEPVFWSLELRQANPFYGPETRPGPLFRARDDPRPNWVAFDVSNDRPQVPFVGNRNTEKPILVDVALETAGSIEVASVHT
jgi:hypothetical protein